MSTKDAILIASRSLALLFLVLALWEICYLPGEIQSFMHYMDPALAATSYREYLRHSYLISLSFLVVRVIGFSLMARWLYKGGREVEELFLPREDQQIAMPD